MIKIASFNICNLGRNSVFKWQSKLDGENSDERGKDIKTIARIIKDNKIDVIAIQEISHPEALKALMEALAMRRVMLIKKKKDATTVKGIYKRSQLTNDIVGYVAGDWEGRWAEPKTSHAKGDGGIGDKSAAEGYAFIWNKKRVDLTKNSKGERFEPRIGFYLKENKLVRPPLVGRFQPKKGYYEIRLINTHILWQATSNMKEANIVDKDKNLREQELRILIENVYVSLANKQYDTEHVDTDAKTLPSYTFLMGDYNMNLPDSNASGNMIPAELITYKKNGMQIVTVNKELTTLKKVPKELEKLADYRNIQTREGHLANNYDHFSYDENRYGNGVKEPKVHVIEAEKYYEKEETEGRNRFEIYNSKISDHLPIALTLDVQHKDTESGGQIWGYLIRKMK